MADEQTLPSPLVAWVSAHSTLLVALIVASIAIALVGGFWAAYTLIKRRQAHEVEALKKSCVCRTIRTATFLPIRAPHTPCASAVAQGRR